MYLPWYWFCAIALWNAPWISPSRCLRMSVKRSRMGTARPAQLQAIDQPLEIDAAQRILGRVDLQVALFANREVTLAPARDVIQLGGFGGRPRGAPGAGARAQASACDFAHLLDKQNKRKKPGGLIFFGLAQKMCSLLGCLTGFPPSRCCLLPKDTNALGTIFGGVILSHIDLASAVEARKTATHRYVTKAMNAVEFHAPVFVGDLVNFFTETTRVGRTSHHRQGAGRGRAVGRRPRRARQGHRGGSGARRRSAPTACPSRFARMTATD